MSAVSLDNESLNDDQIKLQQTYTSRAMAALKQAVSFGYRGAAKLELEPDLAPIRDRQPFQELIAELNAQ